MNDFVFFGIVIFIIGFLAGILAALWWTNRRKNEPEQIAEPDKLTEEKLPVSQEPTKIPVQPIPALKPVNLLAENQPEKTAKPRKEDKNVQHAPKQVDMVTAINDILQDLIRKSDKPTQVVSLTPEPPVGVSVWVNGKRFASLDAVDDEWTRELVRKAVAEWERKAVEKR